ncbi:hypothetical protein SPRG_17127 [Saprolegnia parasitica CBS 223.65]|uniref:ParB/Sulfiredoxin domain-containing protein n=1 Tax=Saprolegnia parasitica (strain CBS 223.65) TaxID=695850 RepID=A0A067BGC6_SAPPC|nr:hypothetical protein SPRG_17127 [Saprolegnia parasitica CBS 223.65]KDO17459.1 hypothetical protein SPRG_17127 [Saprolegnia parasitica CBS 223.65]|eukprot:XP_012211835.1 hypothetical protein SPRG_17127 [Saprolegnia parasitica CBS 223.65]
MALDACVDTCDIALSSIAHDILDNTYFSGTDATTVAELRRHIATSGYDRTDRIRVVFKDEMYFVLDGHHRVAALRELMASSTTLNLATPSDGSYLVPVVVYETERAAEVAAALHRKRLMAYGF